MRTARFVYIVIFKVFVNNVLVVHIQSENDSGCFFSASDSYRFKGLAEAIVSTTDSRQAVQANEASLIA